MNQQPGPQQGLVLSYLALRKAVGIIGVTLPFVLSIGKALLQSSGIESSISYYYYTVMGNVFVGSLWAIGIFLLSTRGYNRIDAIAGRFACLFAIGVSLFPTTPSKDAPQKAQLIGDVHLTFAALLFLTLAFFSLVLFTKTDPTQTPTPQKLQRNFVYRLAGWTIVACIALIAVVKLTALGSAVANIEPVFWLESLAVFVFGVSWLTKGEAILKDK
ncbi:MAG: DUF998 domain-containing protein [Candidatus Acidiferrales bacterium]